MPHTLLLVFIHGFKGSDHTFANFPSDLRALLAHSLPRLDVVSVQYPKYETRGDLNATVAKFKEWLQNKVIDLEVANHTPSPTVEPSVHVVLCGHSMGGIVAAETVLSVAREQTILPPANEGYANDTTNTTTTTHTGENNRRNPTRLAPDDDVFDREERATSAPPNPEPDTTRLFFPFITAVIAFDTPYLGISPGVLAHGAEEHINQASSAYKAFDSASQIFGWGSRSGSTTPQPIPDAAARGLPAPNGTGVGGGGGAWNKWGKYAALGGAAAALAGAAGAAYLNRNQISQGFAWAGSHLEFVNTLAKGADLQKRVEGVVGLGRSHGVGFADFYTALGEKTTSKTKYAGAALGVERTFCVVPKSATRGDEPDSPTGSKRDAPTSSSHPPPKRRKSKEDVAMDSEAHAAEAEQVDQFVRDTSKSKGRWIKCVNELAPDELKAHTTMFTPAKNPNYHVMLPAARDEIVKAVRGGWYERSSRGNEGGAEEATCDGEQNWDGNSDGDAEIRPEDV